MEQNLMVSIVESYPPDLKSTLGLEKKSYTFSSALLKKNRFKLFYECNTGILSKSQRKLYETFIKRVPKDISLFLEPFVISFAVKDACDLSDVGYVWLELDGRNEIGNSAWIKKGDHPTIFDQCLRLLSTHLMKYIVDAYDRSTREEIAGVWKADLKIAMCQVCGTPFVDRKFIVMSGQKLRGWECSECNHHLVLPSDILKILDKKGLDVEKG